MNNNISQPDPWDALKKFTAARIALGRTGSAEPLQSMLQFRLAHALARDAVYAVMEVDQLINELQRPCIVLHSQAANRQEYLQNPDKGRRLNNAQLEAYDSDIAIVIADGLSATAVNNHAVPLLQQLLPKLAGFSIAPICLVHQGRVAVGDEVGELLKAKLVIVLIGERPGLSSPDSLGVYLTFAPTIGLTDEKRNCISNIRPEGLGYTLAADKLFFLIKESLRLKLSGVQLKDNYGLLPPTAPSL